jgi:hypothetical protein
LNQKFKRLKVELEDGSKRSKETSLACEAAVKRHQASVESSLSAMRAVEKEFPPSSNSSSGRERGEGGEAERARRQVGDKLEELRSLLAKSHSERSKEDRFAKIIRTMLITI